MNKNIILLGALVASSMMFSQVGIDTQSPNATLDVVVTADKLNKPFGIIAPRVGGEVLRNAGGQFNIAQDGAIVYATSPVPSGTTGRAKDVLSKGYYYFNATLPNGNEAIGANPSGLWVAMKFEQAAVYKDPWNKTSTGNLPADNATENIYRTGRVGIGTNNPSRTLHVNNTTRGTNEIPILVTVPNMVSGDQTYLKFGQADDGQAGLADLKYKKGETKDKNAFGLGFSGQNPSVNILQTGNVGINTQEPTQKLDINGNVRLQGQVYDNNNVAGISGQVLSTNAQGKVVWLNNVAITPARAAVFPRVDGTLTSLTAQTRLGTTLTLPPGKWSVNVTLLLMTEGNALLSGQSIWIRLTFSDDASGTGNSADIIGSRYASGSLIGPMAFGLINGTVIINNTSGTDKTYYLTKNQQSPYKWGVGVDDNLQLRNLGSGFQSEDQIVAYPMN